MRYIVEEYRYCAWSGEPEEEGSDVRADGCGFGAIGTWILLAQKLVQFGEKQDKRGKPALYYYLEERISAGGSSVAEVARRLSEVNIPTLCY
jgi:hypothetical protein